ncbi:unnamed protein product [Phyllotreta striolata]|uniref:Uncharacterized protein n=1 Tax=Phyllotreta striolata TaxID=444603 RepID=A0A9N9U264_PHYSR|nr:unnamed protein product [Phyllotreta striolata]
MHKTRSCGCKGSRSCYTCENEFNIIKTNNLNIQNGKYIYCYKCNKAWPGWNVEDNPHENHEGEPIEYPGIYIDPDFLTEEEEQGLIEALDSMPWDLSQSGRRKQNFGPKCNFKKRKISLGNFNGFPINTKFVQDKFRSIDMLNDYEVIEQCSLEYAPEKGAHIDPHIDDCWIWGERIITVNLLADSVLTMTYNDKPNRYNLDCVKSYPSVLTERGKISTDNSNYHVKWLQEGEIYPIVRIPMPKRSLLVIYGAARKETYHSRSATISNDSKINVKKCDILKCKFKTC